MKDYLEILLAFRNFFSGVPSDSIEIYLRIMMIGSLAGWLFLVYLAIKLVHCIRLSIVSFIQGYKGDKV